MDAIAKCATAQCGCHSYTCEHCGHTELAFNSCRNRHCPHCIHLVFTLPSFLNDFVLINHNLLYKIVFDASWHAVSKCASSYLGVQTGAISVLHTWGQNLSLHPHVHLLVPSGGLDIDGMQWIASPRKFFLPVRALSKVFRARVLYLLLGAFFDKSLEIPETWKGRNVPEDLKKLTKEKDWVVHAEKSRLSPGKVVEYLGRYIQRVAISNHRIVSVEADRVCFSYKDYADKGKQKQMSLHPLEFIRRFMLHILPKRFSKVRYYGVLYFDKLNISTSSIFRQAQ
jgi:hypothetical protein